MSSSNCCFLNLHTDFSRGRSGGLVFPSLSEFKRWQEYTEELYKKDLQDPDNHDDMITHLEPDILECEVKWALGSITTNKARGGDGIPVELFQILKDDTVKMLHSICQQPGKLNSGHRTGNSQFSFQFQRKTMPKNVQIPIQLHSFHMLARLCSKILQAILQQYSGPRASKYTNWI